VVPSQSPVYLDDPYFARIWSSTPSHRHVPQSLPVVERIGGYKGTSLFQSADSETSMDDTSRISLISSSGPGSTPDDPMILFAKAIDRESERLGEPRPEAALLPSREGMTLSNRSSVGSSPFSCRQFKLKSMSPSVLPNLY
jgi:hypothetical protein